MGLFSNKYPYTDFHELNLDWIIEEVKKLESQLSDFVKINTIKYANPILWDITRQYEANTVVIDGSTGNAYISTVPVPTGVIITNTSFWTSIYNYETRLSQITTSLDNEIETREALSETVSNEITARTEADTALGTRIDQEGAAREQADAALGTRIDQEGAAREQADANLQNQINNISVSDYAIFKNKNILIIGDSISDESNFPNCWVKFLRDACSNLNTRIDAFAINGAALSSTIGSQGIAERYENQPVPAYSYDYAIIIAGINDWGATVPLGNYSSNDYSTFYGSMYKLRETLLSRFPSVKIFWGQIPKSFFGTDITGQRSLVCNLYRAYMLAFSSYYNNNIIDLTTLIPNYSDSGTLDHIHPNPTSAQLISNIVADKVSHPTNEMGDIWDYFNFTPSNYFTGTVQARVNCHGDVIIRLIAESTQSLNANASYPLTDNTNISSYFGTSLVFMPFIFQGANQSISSIQLSDKLYAVPAVSQSGRFVGDVFITSEISQIVQH